MNLLDTIKTIEEVASAQPSVKQIVGGDIYELNTIPDAKYGVFCWQQEQHSGNVQEDEMRFSFVFFYVDRLLDDKSNKIEIQSVGISTLSNILKTLFSKGFDVGAFTINTFNERFVDDCTGAFVRVSIGTSVESVCEDLFN